MKSDRDATLRAIQIDTIRQMQSAGEAWLRDMKLGGVRGDMVLASFLAFWGRQADELAAYDATLRARDGRQADQLNA